MTSGTRGLFLPCFELKMLGRHHLLSPSRQVEKLGDVGPWSHCEAEGLSTDEAQTEPEVGPQCLSVQRPGPRGKTLSLWISDPHPSSQLLLLLPENKQVKEGSF